MFILLQLVVRNFYFKVVYNRYRAVPQSEDVVGGLIF